MPHVLPKTPRAGQGADKSNRLKRRRAQASGLSRYSLVWHGEFEKPPHREFEKPPHRTWAVSPVLTAAVLECLRAALRLRRSLLGGGGRLSSRPAATLQRLCVEASCAGDAARSPRAQATLELSAKDRCAEPGSHQSARAARRFDQASRASAAADRSQVSPSRGPLDIEKHSPAGWRARAGRIQSRPRVIPSQSGQVGATSRLGPSHGPSFTDETTRCLLGS